MNNLYRYTLLVSTVTVLNASVGLNYVNNLRAKAGMPPFVEHTDLNIAAQNHSDYMQINNISGHYEDNTNAGYTGDRPADRAIYAGYFSKTIGENVSYGAATVQGSIDGLFSAIYHRFGFLSLKYDLLGLGINSNFYTYDMGNSILNDLCQNSVYTGGAYYYNVCADSTKKINTSEYVAASDAIMAASNDLILWPPVDSDDIPPAFFEESPDPLPSHGVSGYPVSIEFNTANFTTPPTVLSFTLTDTNETQLNDIILMDSANDPNQKFSDYQFALFPEDRLEWGSRYTAELVYDQAGEETTKTWCFATRSLQATVDKFYKVQSNADIELNVIAGQSYAIYIVPNDSNDKLGGVSYGYSSDAPSFAYIDGNTFSSNITGNIGNYVAYTFSNGQKVKLTIAATDTASTPKHESCPSVPEPVTYAKDDFSSDGIADILWRSGSTNHLWVMHADGTHNYVNIGSKSSSYVVAGLGDFNADGITDILWRKGNSNYLWYMHADGSHTYKKISSKSYTSIAIKDFNNDGIADILWRKDNQNHIWYMHADGSHTYKNIGTKAIEYSISGTGDLNGDGITDILWRKGTSNYIWYMHADGTHTYKKITSKSYTVMTVADFNADGIADILWRKDNNNHIWYMHADGSHTYKNIGTKGVTYSIANTADYNADGITDILWRKGSSNYLWYMHADGSHTYKKISGKGTSYSVQ